MERELIIFAKVTNMMLKKIPAVAVAAAIGFSLAAAGRETITGKSGLRLWENSGKEAAPAPYRIEFEPAADWRALEIVGFEAKGAGPRKALKISLTDAAGIERMYGPFWLEGGVWQNFEFMPAAATWKAANDADFQVDRIASLAFLAEPEMGTMEVKHFAPVVEAAFAGQWRTENLDAAGFMIADGKRFFPIGLYSLLGDNAASAELLFRNSGWENTPENRQKMFDLMRDAGFNTIQSYTSPQFSGQNAAERVAGVARFLDMAKAAGFKVMLNVYGLTAEKIAGTPEEQAAETARREAELADMLAVAAGHPALAAYYVSDEPLSSGTSRKQLNHFYQYIKERDPKHPTVIVECSDAGFTVYRKAADIMAFDPYPVAKNGPADIAEVSRAIRVSQAAQIGGKPVNWAVLQLHQHDERLPGEVEMRAMVMQALALDVRGLFFFAMTYPDVEGPLFIRLPEHWAAVRRVIAEVNALMDFCTSDRRVAVACDVPGVEVLAKQVGDAAFALVAVYPGNGKTALPEVTATFSGLPAGVKSVQLWDGGEAGRMIPVTGGAFSDRFTENAAHVYRWETGK